MSAIYPLCDFEVSTPATQPLGLGVVHRITQKAIKLKLSKSNHKTISKIISLRGHKLPFSR
jgi:hypothetical protein